jgi:hypothetical protein
MKLGTYIMASEPISSTYFKNSSHQSVCLYVYPPLALPGNGSGICLASRYIATIICNNRIVERVVFYAVLVVSNESLWICLYILLSLLGNGSVNTFQRSGSYERKVDE